jgi:2,4-dienoyl-CoA reductase-like NADH-dependent reductase (Old Yellow Enzyme family)
MIDLFSPISINSLLLPNRFVRSATHAFMAREDGRLQDQEIELYRNLSAGGVGLIITGHAYVREDGKASEGMHGLDSDDKIEPFTRAVEAVHAAGAAKLVAQLNYAGAPTFEAKEAGELITAFVDAARRAYTAGVDGVQVHAAHGYFLNQTLSPKTNQRTDRFGGSIGNRARLIAEIIAGIRSATGPDFPILMKLACLDGFPEGLPLEDSLSAALIAQEHGLDAIEISGGMRAGFNMRRPKKPEQEGFFLKEATAFKQKLMIPVISVHGYRTLSRMQEIISSGKVDLISMSRPFIREPDLVNKFYRQEKESADCISCNQCLKQRAELHCVQLAQGAQ